MLVFLLVTVTAQTPCHWKANQIPLSAVEEAFGSQQFSDYITVDDDLVSSELLTDEEIVAQFHSVPNTEQQDEDKNEDGTSETVTEKVSTSQALDCVQGLKNYF
ncbi:hypothetical protein MRX96_000145 [Rhipicephalus microplus]